MTRCCETICSLESLEAVLYDFGVPQYQKCFLNDSYSMDNLIFVHYKVNKPVSCYNLSWLSLSEIEAQSTIKIFDWNLIY